MIPKSSIQFPALPTVVVPVLTKSLNIISHILKEAKNKFSHKRSQYIPRVISSWTPITIPPWEKHFKTLISLTQKIWERKKYLNEVIWTDAAPLGLRLLGVLPLVYRLWASARLRRFAMNGVPSVAWCSTSLDLEGAFFSDRRIADDLHVCLADMIK